MRKFTLFIASLFLALGAMAQITDANQLSNYKCYHITSKDANRGAFYAKPGDGYLSHCGGTYGNYLNKDVARNTSSTAQQFAFVSYDGKLYLWSVSEKKFAQKEGNFIKLVKTTTDFVTVTPNGSYFNININGTNKLNFSGGYDYGVYANYQNDDDGNNLVITEAGSFDPTEAIAALEGDYLEDNITLAWNTSTTWSDAEGDLSSTVLNDNAMANGIKYVETEITVRGARTATVTFRYTSGNCALNIRGVEVLNQFGLAVAGDYHVGKAGGSHENNVYTVKVAEAGTYTVRVYATFDGDNRANATNGNITVAFAAADAASFSHDVTFTAEYATLYLGYQVAIPEGVEAYVVESASDGYAHLVEIENAIPETTAVILKNVGDKTAYRFDYSSENITEFTDNLLEGSIADRYVTGDAYVLTLKNNNVCLGGVLLNQLNGAAFLNNANKAYLPMQEGVEGIKSYSFRFGEGTTGIDEMTEQRAESKEIYDITGRRVENVTAPGIYLVNGKKVLVK